MENKIKVTTILNHLIQYWVDESESLKDSAILNKYNLFIKDAKKYLSNEKELIACSYEQGEYNAYIYEVNNNVKFPSEMISKTILEYKTLISKQATALTLLHNEWESQIGSYIPNAPFYKKFITDLSNFIEKEQEQYLGAYSDGIMEYVNRDRYYEPTNGDGSDYFSEKFVS